MAIDAQNPCPAWCESRHPANPGHMHRREVGRLWLRGEPLLVIIQQAPGFPARIALGGLGYMEIGEDDLDDARAIFTALGFPFLAQLVNDAAEIVQPFNDALRLAQDAEDQSRS